MRPTTILSLFALLALFLSGPFAEDDPYAVTPSKAKADTVKSARMDSVKPVMPAPVVDTVKTTVAVPDSTPPAPEGPKVKAKPRVVRETTVNTLDAIKGRYRSPKKALFMSLVVPGLGQAYIGGSFNYARAVGYIGVDVTMGLLWHQYSVVKYDRQVKRYRRFADENWRQERYEDFLTNLVYSTDEQYDLANPFREGYCEAVQERETTQGNKQFEACKDPKNPAVVAGDLTAFQAANQDITNPLISDSPDSVHAHREKNFQSLFYFYELIGKEQEFVTGWDDAIGTSVSADSVVAGTSVHSDQYIDMRATANRYARMQAWFIGGMVLNHIISALDAALAARSHNKALYQTEVSWFDRVRLEGGLTFNQGIPRTSMLAALSF